MLITVQIARAAAACSRIRVKRLRVHIDGLAVANHARGI
jgi:hypothetical protein